MPLDQGFPSTAQEYYDGQIDLTKMLIDDQAATFVVRAAGDSMLGIDIRSGDESLITRSKHPLNGGCRGRDPERLAHAEAAFPNVGIQSRPAQRLLEQVRAQFLRHFEALHVLHQERREFSVSEQGRIAYSVRAAYTAAHRRTLDQIEGVRQPLPLGRLLRMTEMWAALAGAVVGAIVGGLLSAWVGSKQTAKVLKHETDMAAAERKEAQRADEERRHSAAADHLITALAEYMTLSGSVHDGGRAVEHFVRMATTADVHRDRDRRTAALLQASASYAHALPEEVRERWDALIWVVRFNSAKQSERSDGDRRRDYSDLRNYSEYVRRSLTAVTAKHPMPPHYPAPDVRREERKPWGYSPEDAEKEPDLTDWQLSDRLVGRVSFSTGELRWYGPNGLVEDLPRAEAAPTAED
ncbi:hypothetical protein KZC52_15590 [Microbacterium sp. kSW2-24]|uniref:LexA family protein n=1 Tax=Microbacterium galbinum TaxID=2851646 RepID=UPI001FFC4F79|nr:S24 family peptidase [Microbacterium galbinum]MCK2024355.1 hypothetical protein [Microbacterium galbinum]